VAYERDVVVSMEMAQKGNLSYFRMRNAQRSSWAGQNKWKLFQLSGEFSMPRIVFYAFRSDIALWKPDAPSCETLHLEGFVRQDKVAEGFTDSKC
jgi:hypothetical protein